MANTRIKLVTTAMLGALALALYINPARAIPLFPGDILVTVRDAGTPRQNSKIVRIDGGTGVQSLFAEGGLLSDGALNDIEVEATGDIIVAIQDGLVRIDRNTGSQSLVTSGGLADSVVYFDIDTDGSIVSSRFLSPTGGFPPKTGGGVFRVDPVSGAQDLISEKNLLGGVRGIAVALDGRILTATTRLGTQPLDAGGIVAIDPATGMQSQLGVTGFLNSPQDIVVDPFGDIFVTELYITGGSIPPGESSGGIIKIDPNDGTQSQFSLFGRNFFPQGIDIDLSGDFIVANQFNLLSSPIANSIVRVDSLTGDHSILSESGLLGGTPDNCPRCLLVGVAVVPAPAPATIALLCIGLAGLGFTRLRGAAK